MREFRIKMTAQRTNPQEIREVLIAVDRTVGELIELCRIVFEYENVRGSLTDDKKTAQAPERKLSDVLEKEMFYKVTDADGKAHPVSLELLEEVEREKASDIPSLVRYRHVPGRSRILTGNGFCEIHQDFSKYMDKEIRKVFAPDTVLPNFDWRIAREWKSMLDRYTLTDMRRIIKTAGLSINLYLRKNEMVKELNAVADETFFEKIMERMGIGEYMHVRQVCTTGMISEQPMEKAFPVLKEYGLIDRIYWYGTILSKEFMSFYESWLEQGKEKQYLNDRAAESCFVVACRLYGFVDQELQKDLLQVLCPDDEKIHENTWKNAKLYADRNQMTKAVGLDIYCDGSVLHPNHVPSFYQSYLANNKFHYIPTKSEIETLTRSDFSLPEKDRKILIGILENRFRCEKSEVDLIASEVARAVHMGMTNDEIFDYFERVVRNRRVRVDIPELVAVLDRTQNNMRKISLSGFTQKEFDEQLASRKVTRVTQKSYPNEPCPCGSGKKYKHCCGKG